MFSYIIKRLLLTIPTLLGVSLLVFAMVRLAPGDPALLILGEHATKEKVEILRAEMGLNKSFVEQYYIFMSNILKGDMGTSLISNEPALEEFLKRFPATVELALMAMIFALVIGICMGIISALKRHSAFDYISMGIALSGVSMPIFWLGFMLIYIFSVILGWLPVSGRLGYEYDIDTITGMFLVDSLILKDYEAFWSAFKHILIPSIALGTIPMAIIARLTRSSMIEVLKEDYIKTAKAKGCSNIRVIFIHALRNALLPVLTIIGLMLGALFGGAVLTEVTFSWPGIGKWFVNAVQKRDFIVIQSTTLIIACIFITMNLIVDVLYALINPKIRLS